jgi:hypothetical protein
MSVEDRRQTTRPVRIKRETARRIKTVASHKSMTIVDMLDQLLEPALSRLEREAAARLGGHKKPTRTQPGSDPERRP